MPKQLALRFKNREQRLPLLFFMGVIAVLCFVMWSMARIEIISENSAQQASKLELLRGTITHLDEVLTMSARMAASTGSVEWEERYSKFEPKLNLAIKEAISLSGFYHDLQSVNKTDVANIKLVKMEKYLISISVGLIAPKILKSKQVVMD